MLVECGYIVNETSMERLSISIQMNIQCTPSSIICSPMKYIYSYMFNAEPCTIKKDPGTCKEYQPMWYFEPITGVCRRFLYGGCDGNGNRFLTSDECLQRCGKRSKLHPGTPSHGNNDDNVHVTTDVTSVGSTYSCLNKGLSR